MLRSLVTRAATGACRLHRNVVTKQLVASHTRTIATTAFRWSGGSQLSEEEIDDGLEKSLNVQDIDGWEIRQILQQIHGRDAVPEPRIIAAGLEACRRVNDFGLSVRFLEACKFKCGHHEKEIWPWLMQELKPTMDKLGVPNPDDLGYDKPEFFFKEMEDM